MEVIVLPQENLLWRTFHIHLPFLIHSEIAIPSIACDNATRNLRSRKVDSSSQIERCHGQQDIAWVIIAWVSEGDIVIVNGRDLPESCVRD